MKTNIKKVFFMVVATVVLASICFAFLNKADVSELVDTNSKDTLESVSAQSSSTKTYKGGEYVNSKYKFSFKVPEGFKVREIASEEIHTTLIENKKGEGIQILVSPFDDIRILTGDMIRKDLPNFKITNEQTVEIDDGYKGLSFKSDNSAFAGASREIWFVYHGNLYQISTYEILGELLKSLFTTWKFT